MRLFKRNKALDVAESRNLLLRADSPFAISEAYKAMRTNLMYIKTESACKKFVFTSAMTGEGKSTVCANTAITFAQVGKRVLIIDADMRRPRQHRLFAKPLSPGLSDVLAGLSESMVVHKTDYENLQLLTAGRIPPNPAELLASKRMDTLLEEISHSFDYVFVDMPPLNMVTDAAVLTDKVDGYIMVVRAEQVPTDDVKEAVLALEQVNANIVGMLLNNVRRSGGRYYRKGYYKRGYYKSGYSYSAMPQEDEPPETDGKSKKNKNKSK